MFNMDSQILKEQMGNVCYIANKPATRCLSISLSNRLYGLWVTALDLGQSDQEGNRQRKQDSGMGDNYANQSLLANPSLRERERDV